MNSVSYVTLTYTLDAQASLGYSNRCILWTAHQPLSSTMCSDDDINWPVHSLMLSLCDLCSLLLQRLPSTVPCSMIFSSISWWHTCQNHNNLLCLMVDSKSSWRPARILTGCHTCSFVLCPLYDMPGILLFCQQCISTSHSQQTNCLLLSKRFQFVNCSIINYRIHFN